MKRKIKGKKEGKKREKIEMETEKTKIGEKELIKGGIEGGEGRKEG